MSSDDKTLPVLVVDDDWVVQQFVSNLIAHIPFLTRRAEFDFAKDGQEALTQLHRKVFALVVLDWELPVFGKGEVLRQMRKNYSPIPVVVISGSDPFIADEVKALKAAFLSKDRMTPETFRSAIAIALALLNFPPSLFFEKWTGATE